jgi:hypothetical protein
MATEVTRRGIAFDAEDTAVIEELKQELRPKYGVQTVTAIVRMALRSFLEQQREST